MPPNESDPLSYKPSRGLKLAGLLLAGVAGVVVVVGVIGRVNADQDLKVTAGASATPTVGTIVAKPEKAGQTLTLPAEIQPFESAPIHARTPGYVKQWYPDLGAKVRKGEVLVAIDTPDLDQQLLQARADLETVRANQALSQSTAARWKELLSHDAVSQQEYDEKAGDLAARNSLVNSSRANVARLEAMSAFKRVEAPFDGVVTARAAHVGQLVATGGSDTPLYTVADVRKLRVFIRLPQAYVADIKPGMTAELTTPERPKETFTAKVVGDAQALNSQSGTLLVELQIDNSDGRLKAGGYAQASFKLPVAVDVATLPASALMYRTQGPVVATVDPQGVVTIRPVSIARDMGSSVQLASGIEVGAQVVDNPPDSLATGDKVHVVAGKPKAANG